MNKFSKMIKALSLIIQYHYLLNHIINNEGILDCCPPEKRGNLYHISNTLCAGYINEKITSEWLKIDTNPKHFFEIVVKSKKFRSSY